MKKMLMIANEADYESYRISRIIEEAEKNGIEIVKISNNLVKLFADEVWYGDKKLELAEFEYVYSIGNSTTNHYIIQLASCTTNSLIWPSKDHLSMNDKFSEGIFLNSKGVPMPKTILLNSKRQDIVDDLVNRVGGYPCVIKKVTGSEGKFVSLINSYQEAIIFIENFPHLSIFGKRNIILQEYIKESKGTDFRVFCVGDEILGAIQRTASDDNFKANISLGGSAKQIEVTPEMEKYAKIIMKEGKMMFAGIDFIKSDRGYLVLEINTSADFKGFERASGINVAEKIIKKFLEQKE